MKHFADRSVLGKITGKTTMVLLLYDGAKNGLSPNL